MQVLPAQRLTQFGTEALRHFGQIPRPGDQYQEYRQFCHIDLGRVHVDLCSRETGQGHERQCHFERNLNERVISVRLLETCELKAVDVRDRLLEKLINSMLCGL